MAVVVEVAMADLARQVAGVVCLLMLHVVVHKLVPLWIVQDLPVFKLFLEQGNVRHQFWQAGWHARVLLLTSICVTSEPLAEGHHVHASFVLLDRRWLLHMRLLHSLTVLECTCAVQLTSKDSLSLAQLLAHQTRLVRLVTRLPLRVVLDHQVVVVVVEHRLPWVLHQ